MASPGACKDPQKATWEDLLALDEDVRAEVLGGALVTMPAPLPRHANVQRSLGNFVGGPFQDDDGRGGPGGWWIFVEVDIRLGLHDIVSPTSAAGAARACRARVAFARSTWRRTGSARSSRPRARRAIA
jgi:hypothetical protein